MSIQEHWEKAVKQTVIVRPRVKPLETFAATKVPYLLLSESSINTGDTVRREGEIDLQKPNLILPGASPQFYGFDFDKLKDTAPELLTSFLLVRGVSFPSLKYSNKTGYLDIYEGNINRAKQHFGNELQRKEDVVTTLLLGPEDCWQFSLLILIMGQVGRCAEGDIRRILDKFKDHPPPL
jgi:hypothetical protein